MFVQKFSASDNSYISLLPQFCFQSRSVKEPNTYKYISKTEIPSQVFKPGSANAEQFHVLIFAVKGDFKPNTTGLKAGLFP